MDYRRGVNLNIAIWLPNAKFEGKILIIKLCDSQSSKTDNQRKPYYHL